MDKLNLLVFMTDQQRGDSVLDGGHCIVPNFERLAKRATAFTNAHCVAPHCCPSRASFFSGLYPSEHGAWNNVDVENALSPGLNEGVRLWSQDLADAGYGLYHAGKWHLSIEHGPDAYGFHVGFNTHGRPYPGPVTARRVMPQREWLPYATRDCHADLNGRDPGASRPDGCLMREGYPDIQLYGQSEQVFRDETSMAAVLGRIRACADAGRPFGIFCGLEGPHDPYLAPQRFLDLYPLDSIELPDNFRDSMDDKPGLYRRMRERFDQLSERECREAIRHYRAVVSWEDEQLGILLDALEETGQLDNTVVIALSDHGDYCGEHGLFAKGLPAFRGAYHIPLLIAHPRLPGGSRFGQFVSLVDLAPTILDIMGIAYPDDRFSGRSLLPFLQSRAPEDWPGAVYTQTNGNELYAIQRTVATARYKYVYNGFDFDELYDLQTDPGECVNLARRPEYRDVSRELLKLIWTHARKHKDVCVNPYTTVSLAAFGPGIIDEFTRSEEAHHANL